jgi:hypothetical protein
MAVFGDLDIPKEQMDRWLASPLDGAAFKGWTGYLRETRDERTVAQLIEALKSWSEEGFVEVSEERGKLSLRGLLPKDPFMDWGPQIATAFRAAGPLGGNGDLYFVGFMTTDLAYGVQIGAGGSKLAELSDVERQAAEELPGFTEVATLVERMIGG